MCVGPVDIWGTEDYVAFLVAGYCDVLVTAACFDEESAGIVSVELGARYFCDV
jgi:hypothetical protein